MATVLDVYSHRDDRLAIGIYLGVIIFAMAVARIALGSGPGAGETAPLPRCPGRSAPIRITGGNELTENGFRGPAQLVQSLFRERVEDRQFRLGRAR
ncbi:hypothetical protein ACIRRA_16330 [Nocardia sp. NPDC101769]|uniref:hypothetical protein n=1 Tax=Nocardia sp. NPDC101769 TaxID=3364333 RepID=UPI00380BC459